MATGVYDSEKEGEQRYQPPDFSHLDDQPAGRPGNPAGHDVAAGDPSDPRGEGPDKLDRAGLRDAETAKGDSEGGLFNKEGGREGVGGKGLRAAETAAAGAAAAATGGGVGTAARAVAGRAKRMFWGSKNRKRATIGGGAATAAVGATLVVGSLLSGPLEFIHIAQMLQKFHFASNQEESADRFSKLVRYARYSRSDETYRTNLNYVGNKMADKFETKLNEQGLRSAYTKTFGLKEGYVIDRNNERFAGLTDEQIQQELRAAYQNPELEVTTYKDARGVEQLLLKQPSGYRASKSITKGTLRDYGDGKITSAIGARIMGVRDGVSWHPLRKLDKKLYGKLEERIKVWNEERVKNISEGVPDGPTGVAEPQEEGGENQQQKDQTKTNADVTAAEGDAVAKEGAALGQETRAGGDIDGKGLSSYTEKINGKVLGGVGGSVAAAGVLCMARGIAETADVKKDDQVIKPLERDGMRALSEGNQLMSNQDIDIDQVALDSRQLANKKTQKSWYDAESIQAEVGSPDKGVPPDGTLRKLSNGSPLDFLISGTPLATALNPICSTAGQIVQGVVGFLGGPVSFIGGTLVSAAVGPPIIDAIAQYLSGQAINLNASGPMFGNYINFGAFLAANSQATSAGGRALSSQEVAQLDNITNADYKAQFEKRSLAYRLFNPTDHMSLISGIIDRQSGSVSGNVQNMAFAALNVRQSLATTFGNIFSGVSQAATPPYDYGGVPKIGFSVDEMNNPATANPYANGDAAAALLDSNGQNGVPDYIDRAQKCFGANIEQVSVPGPNSGSNQVWDVKFSHEPLNTFSSEYKSKAGECNDTGQDWLKIRFFIFDTQNIKAANCYEGDDASCTEMGFGSAATESAPGAEDIAAVSGDAQELARTILANKNIDLDCYSSTVRPDVQAAANGQPGTAGAPVNPLILQLIATIGQNHKLCITALESGGQGHSSNSYHYTGDAIDFGSLDGTMVTGRNGVSLEIIRIAEAVLPSGTGIGQSQCGSTPSLPSGWTTFEDSCNHLHIQVPRSN